MKLTLLGTGTPTPSTVRSGSSYLLETAEDMVLFDCGPGSYFRYLQTGRALTQISHIVFSHLHYDHCADFAAIALARWDQSGGQVPDLTIIGPPGITLSTRSWVRRVHLRRTRKPAPTIRAASPTTTSAAGWATARASRRL